MFYSLMLLQTECCGTDIMKNVQEITNGRVKIGAGTLYTILEGFETANYVKETKVEGRKRSYIITQIGIDALNKEKTRLETLLTDLNNYNNLEKEN